MVIFIVMFLASIAALFYILIKNFKKKTKIVSSVLCVVLAVSSIIAGLNYISKAKLTDYNWNEWVKNKETISDTVESLRNTEEYKSANYDEKVKLMEQCLKQLQEKGLIKNLHYNDYIFHFDYSLSGSGGIVVKDTHNDNCWGSFHNARTKSIKFNQSIFNKSLLNYANLPSSTNLKNQNWAFIFNTSAIKDNESYNQFSWLASECKDLNINVRMQKNSTVSMYRNLSNKDLIYITGHAFYDEKKSIPIIWTVEQLTEEKLKNTDYMSDIISDINNNSIGIYKDESEQDFFVILPEFFENNYSNNELDGSIVLFGNCEIFGNNDKECLALYNSLKKSGVSAVIGFCNSVNQKYSLFFHEKIINCLLRGKTIGDAFEEAKDTIGKNENEYFKEYYTDLSLEEKPAFPILKGLTNKKIIYNDLDNLGKYGFTIKDIDSKNPIKNVRVFIYNSENDRECVHSYKSNEKGDVSVELPDGKYTCELAHPNYQKTSYNITIKNDMLTTLFDPVYMTKKNYTWLVEPTIEADDIIVFDNSYVPDVSPYINDWNTNKSDRGAPHSKYAIIKKDNNYGFIDYNGQLISKNFYQYFHGCYCGEVFIGDSKSGEDSVRTNVSKNMTIIYGQVGHGMGAPYAYYAENYKKLYGASCVGSSDDLKIGEHPFAFHEISNNKYSGLSSIYSIGTARLIKISDLDADNAEITEIKNKYALFNKGKLTSDFIFEKAYSDCYGQSNIAACKKDGKWGYYSYDGKKIIPCQFDDVENKLSYYKSGNGEIYDDTYEAYLPTYGYIAVNKDGGYGYYNTDGKEVIPCGEFEQARPVYGGKAWVKKDGKWGVIKLETNLTEQQLKKSVKEKAGKEPVKWFYDDYNNDGLYEAFAVFGTGENACFDTVVQYVDSEGSISVVFDNKQNKNYDNISDIKITKHKGRKFISFTASIGSSLSAYVYSVKDLNYYELGISKKICKFNGDTATISKFKKGGGHYWPEVELDFDENGEISYYDEENNSVIG